MVVSTALHSGRGCFLPAMTPATPALLTWSALTGSREGCVCCWDWPTEGNTGLGGVGGGVELGSAEYRVCLHIRPCESSRVCVNGSCDEGSACRIFQRKKEKSFSRDEILGSLEAQRTVGALFPPSTLNPSPLLSLSDPLHFLLPCPTSFHICVINIVYRMQAGVHAPKKRIQITTAVTALLWLLCVSSCAFPCHF